MRPTLKTLAMTLLIGPFACSLVACDAQVKQFVDIQPNLPTAIPPTPTGSFSLKVSPGELTTSSTNLGLKATVSPTQQKMTSASLGMIVGISKLSKQ